MRRSFHLMLAALALSASPVAAQPRPQPPGPEAALLAELTRLEALPDLDARMAGLDRLLARQDQPTATRAFVQTIRASQLSNISGRLDEAQVAIEDALRIAPDAPLTQLTAANILTYRHEEARAAELWMAASRAAPALAAETDPYDLEALLERLASAGLNDSADALVSRMVAIGHSGADTALRTNAAAARVRRRLEAGDIEGATEAMRSVVGFETFLSLYTDRRFEAIWPAMDRWTRGDLVNQQEASLRAYRSDSKRGDSKGASRYAAALTGPSSWPTVLKLFEPLMTETGDEFDPFYQATLSTSVAQAMVGAGRPDDAVALLTRLADGFDPNNPAPGLTARANLAQTQLMLGRPAEALATTDRFREDAKSLMGGGNTSGLAATEVVRACALLGEGRKDEAERTIAELAIASRATPPAVAWDWFSCHGDTDAAKGLVKNSLADPDRRGWALSVLQPSAQYLPTDSSRREHEFAEAVRADPDLRAEAARYGRLLNRSYNDSLPAGFDPRG